MFLKENAVKKLIKAAYNRNELLIANLQQDYIICGSRCVIRIDKNRLPNKIKGAIIELTGEFPVKGEKRSYGRDNEYFSEETSEEEWESRLNIGQAVYAHTVTNSLYERCGALARIIQAEDGKKHALPESVVAAVKNTEDVYGPMGRDNWGKEIFWYDDDCILVAYAVENDREREMLDRMADINLPDRYQG